jgi:hypothetical protein
VPGEGQADAAGAAGDDDGLGRWGGHGVGLGESGLCRGTGVGAGSEGQRGDLMEHTSWVNTGVCCCLQAR